MIEHILGHARFKTPDATISVNFQPKEGITAVVGPNGVGKTFTAIESLRYLMFGSRALRGKLDTYAELSLSGIVTIRHQRYTIERSLKTAKVFDTDGTQMAVGQEEVTRKVEELLGYGLEVFDLCNAAVQGETQSLGELTAGKRKEKIDEVLRVSDVRAVEKALRDEANALKREAEALTRALPQIGDAPSAPAGYQASADLEQQLDAARDLRRQREKLISQIVNVSVPDEPTTRRLTTDEVAEIEHLEAQRKAFEAAVSAMPLKLPMTEEQIVLAEARYEWEQQREARGPAPDMLLADVRSELAVLDEIVAIERMPDIEAHCPKCDHEFRTRPEVPAAPPHTRRELQEQLARHEKHADALPTEPDTPYSLSPSAAESERKDRARYEAALEAQKALKVLPRATLTASEARQSVANWNAYDQAVEKKRVRDVDNAMIERALADLPLVPDTDQLSSALTEARLFEASEAHFTREKARFDELQADITAKMQAVDDFLDGNKTLAEARAELKSFLAPALSREASSLIVDMTNGVLQSLIIDEDMNITVDGQTLETLSGAGKTVANIALRIALTKVLTGSTFPVFLGDEMDGDLDDTRREATAQALVSLKDQLKQIILITHKDVDIADHVVNLGDTK